MPGARLHGSSVRGPAAAPVSDVVRPTPVVPVNKTLAPSNVRRSSSPLPATGSSGGRPLGGRADLAIGFLPDKRRGSLYTVGLLFWLWRKKFVKLYHSHRDH